MNSLQISLSGYIQMSRRYFGFRFIRTNPQTFSIRFLGVRIRVPFMVPGHHPSFYNIVHLHVFFTQVSHILHIECEFSVSAVSSRNVGNDQIMIVVALQKVRCYITNGPMAQGSLMSIYVLVYFKWKLFN